MAPSPHPHPSAAAPELDGTPHIASSPGTAKPSGFASTQASLLLDIVRGLAAILVLIGHWRSIFFVDFPGIPAAQRWLFAVPYVLGSAGHESVIVFFVLSGYLISGSVFRMFQRDAWSWRSYLLHRLVRLWIVLVPGLTLAALCDGIGLHLHRAPAVALYSGTPGNLIQPHNIAASFHLSIWLGNLTFLQNTFIPIFGSDAPLWSLANEFWYYILFPLGLLALRRQTPLAARLLCAILFATIALTLDRAIIYVFPVWLLGTLLSVLPAPRFTAFWRTAAAIVYVPVLLFFGHFRTIHTILADQIFGLITFGFLYVLLSAHAPTHERHLTTRLWRTLARFSYTLYVVHLPFLLLIAALILPATRWIPNPIHIAYAAAFFVLALAYAYILAFFTEFRTDALRKAIERRLP